VVEEEEKEINEIVIIIIDVNLIFCSPCIVLIYIYILNNTDKCTNFCSIYTTQTPYVRFGHK
jgi:hypothetical protein